MGQVPLTKPPTVSFDRLVVVRVPFSFTDRDTSRNCPALVLCLMPREWGRLTPEDAANVRVALTKLRDGRSPADPYPASTHR
jgi:hypothetical protein